MLDHNNSASPASIGAGNARLIYDSPRKEMVSLTKIEVYLRNNSSERRLRLEPSRTVVEQSNSMY